MNFKKHFPILSKITYLDSAASLLKPISVIQAIEKYYLEYPINPHSGDSALGQKVLSKINQTRELVANLVDAKKEEVIFTSGTTQSLNMIADMLGPTLKKGDEIIISQYNHDANIMPWIKIAKIYKIKLIITKNVLKAITKKTKIVSISQKNNAFGHEEDIKDVYKQAKKMNALVINDAAQAITTTKVSFNHCDVIAFSGTKIFGPTGTGALIMKAELMKTLQPTYLGGGAVADIKIDKKFVLKTNYHKFEAGTPNSAGIIGLGEGIKFLNKTIPLRNEIAKLTKYCQDKLSQLQDFEIQHFNKGGIILINHKTIPAQDIVSALAHNQKIYLRTGKFCAHLSNNQKNGLIRISINVYNNKNDIDKLIAALAKGDFFDYV